VSLLLFASFNAPVAAVNPCSTHQRQQLTCAEKTRTFILYYLRIDLSLHKTGIASAITSKLDCARLALSLHKTGIASAITSKLDCARLALSLHKTGSHEFGHTTSTSHQQGE